MLVLMVERLSQCDICRRVSCDDSRASQGDVEPRPVACSPLRVPTKRVSPRAVAVGGGERRCSDGGKGRGTSALSTAH